MRPKDPSGGFSWPWRRHVPSRKAQRARVALSVHRRPDVELLEHRELLSTTASSTHLVHSGARSGAATVQALGHSTPTRQRSLTSKSQVHVDSPNGLLGRGPVGPFVNPAVIQQFSNLLYGPNAQTPMTPSAAEIQRQTFTVQWIGQYTVGAPRFSDRASTIHLWSKNGGGDALLKGKIDMVLFPPADSAATPTPGNPFANQVTGVAGVFPQNALQTGGALILDINGNPAPGSDALALPTHLTWTYDSNSSGGNFAAPSGFTQGAGTLDIRWMPDPSPVAGSTGSGTVIVTFQGLLNYSQLNSSVSKFIS
jgi:hypothetical protein